MSPSVAPIQQKYEYSGVAAVLERFLCPGGNCNFPLCGSRAVYRAPGRSARSESAHSFPGRISPRRSMWPSSTPSPSGCSNTPASASATPSSLTGSPSISTSPTTSRPTWETPTRPPRPVAGRSVPGEVAHRRFGRGLRDFVPGGARFCFGVRRDGGPGGEPLAVAGIELAVMTARRLAWLILGKCSTPFAKSSRVSAITLANLQAYRRAGAGGRLEPGRESPGRCPATARRHWRGRKY